MDWLFSLALGVNVLVGLGVIALVLMQHGKGADMGAAFGGGSSGSLFGASGSANFLSRVTAVLAAVFIVTSLMLTYIASQIPDASNTSIMQGADVGKSKAVPNGSSDLDGVNNTDSNVDQKDIKAGDSASEAEGQKAADDAVADKKEESESSSRAQEIPK